MNLIYFLRTVRHAGGMSRRIATAWETSGEGDHCRIFDDEKPLDWHRVSRLVPADRFQAAGVAIDGLLSAGVRRIEEVRGWLIRHESNALMGTR
jgi:hypothetical protein